MNYNYTYYLSYSVVNCNCFKLLHQQLLHTHKHTGAKVPMHEVVYIYTLKAVKSTHTHTETRPCMYVSTHLHPYMDIATYIHLLHTHIQAC